MTIDPSSLGFTSTFLDLPGLGRMHVVSAGPLAGKPVILLHGFPDFWYGWRHQITALAQAGYRVIAPDQRGYNVTSKSPPYDLITVAGDIVNLMGAIGVERAHVVGHDWGAAVAWTLAGLHPERLDRLAILNVPHPLAYNRILARPDLRQWLRSYYVALFQIAGLSEWLLSRNNYALMRRAMRSSARPGAFSDETLARLVAAWSQPGALSAMLGWYQAFGVTGRRILEQRARFERIAAPTLILWGERDVALVPALAAESARHLDHGRLVRLPEATHWLHEEFPDLINQHLLEHLAA